MQSILQMKTSIIPPEASSTEWAETPTLALNYPHQEGNWLPWAWDECGGKNIIKFLAENRVEAKQINDRTWELEYKPLANLSQLFLFYFFSSRLCVIFCLRQ